MHAGHFQPSGNVGAPRFPAQPLLHFCVAAAGLSPSRSLRCSNFGRSCWVNEICVRHSGTPEYCVPQRGHQHDRFMHQGFRKRKETQNQAAAGCTPQPMWSLLKSSANERLTRNYFGRTTVPLPPRRVMTRFFACSWEPIRQRRRRVSISLTQMLLGQIRHVPKYTRVLII